MKAIRVVVAALLAAGLSASEASDIAIERGLPALVRMQRPDGSFGDGNAITALAGMALLAGGHTPTRGSLREHSMRALRSVMARQDPYSGYLGTATCTRTASPPSTSPSATAWRPRCRCGARSRPRSN
ncbi:MAG: hypothetical protein L6R48_12160 [Planctomycetes bacterium]|nr:hypothetical protein [Planctomycetota bacterium]